MALDESELQNVLSALRRARELEWPRLANIRAYMRNEMADIYVPKEATDEYRMLVDQARFNVLPLVRDALAQALFVDGYRPTGPSGRAPSAENSPIWDLVWQPNRMDARQASIHKAAITYGAAYVTVLPGEPVPVIRPYSPFRLTALYADPVNDEWPKYAMMVDHADALSPRQPMQALAQPLLDPVIAQVMADVTVRVFDESAIYTIRIPSARSGRADPEVVKVEEHKLGVCPVVRYLDSTDADGESIGKIEPLLPLQRQLNQTTFSLLMTQQYQAFRQRWATGMAIEQDEDGNPLEPWNAAVNAVWQNESPHGKFGDFEEANLSGYLESRDRQLMFVSAVGQVPPHSLVLGAGISNISAEALAALGASAELDRDDHKTTFGEGHEQTARLAGKALAVANKATPEQKAQGESVWEDTSAQVVWRDTTPRSLAQVADALGKLATLLEIPPEALWQRIPGTTDQDLDVWKAMKDEREKSRMAEMADLLEETEAMVGPRPAQLEQVNGNGRGPGSDDPVPV